MFNIQLGSFNLNGQLILYIVFVFAGWLALQLRSTKDKVAAYDPGVYVNAFFIWFITAKLSQILFQPMVIIQHPLMLLYFDGGEKGRWFAGAFALIYLYLNGKKSGLSWEQGLNSLFMFSLAGFTATNLLLLIYGQENLQLWYAANAVITLGFLFGIRKQGNSIRLRGHIESMGWISLAMVASGFLNHADPLLILTFSQQQIMFLVLGLISFVAAYANESKRN